jgi:hypothetical protein
MKRYWVVAGLVPVLLCAGNRELRLSRNVQLFVDDLLIERMDRVARGLHYPERAPENPVLKAEMPWEGNVVLQPGTVLFDEEEHIFKMWYNALPVKDKPDIEQFVCYAVSKDGIHWTRPSLGAVQFHGSAENNIVLKWCYWNLSVVKDGREPDPAKRYRMACWDWQGRAVGSSGIWVAASPDGIHWTIDPNSPVVPSTASGDTFCVMQDPVTRRFWLYHKSPMEPLRKISRLESTDFVHWTGDRLVLEQDERDQPDTEFYGVSPFPYGDQYLGFLWVLHTYSQQVDIQLVSSRDGRAWSRSANRRVFFPLGYVKVDYDNDAFDSEMIMSITPPVARDGRLWMYYTGYANKHNAREGILNPGGLGTSYLGQIGLATLPEDGFCSLDATSEGSVLTRVLRFDGSTMHVRAELLSLDGPERPFREVWRGLLDNVPDGKGSIKVEVQDPAGKVIPGYAASDCVAGKEGLNGLRLSWKGGKDLSALRGRPVRFRFIVSNARLFSFRVD